MPTPPKPFEVLKSEKKSHRTKSELRQREIGEKELLSGISFKERSEVKNDRNSHKEFNRVKDLMQRIGKNDALYEPIINRYCQLQAECKYLEESREAFNETHDHLLAMFNEIMDISNFETKKERAEIYAECSRAMADMMKSFIACDVQVQQKRRMLLDIEKECCFTVASALRSIPKKQESKQNPLLEALGKNG